MIIQNGTIEIKKTTGGGINPETGHPMKPETSWGNPIACQYNANKYDRLGRVNGEHFTIASFIILIEEIEDFEAGMIRIKDMTGKEIGEYSVINIEPLNAVCEIRIYV